MADAWMFELARFRNQVTGEYSGWEKKISFTKPNAGEAMRNVMPLFVASRAIPAKSFLSDLDAHKLSTLISEYGQHCYDYGNSDMHYTHLELQEIYVKREDKFREICTMLAALQS